MLRRLLGRKRSEESIEVPDCVGFDGAGVAVCHELLGLLSSDTMRVLVLSVIKALNDGLRGPTLEWVRLALREAELCGCLSEATLPILVAALDVAKSNGDRDFYEALHAKALAATQMKKPELRRERKAIKRDQKLMEELTRRVCQRCPKLCSRH